MTKHLLTAVCLVAAAACNRGPSDGVHTLRVLTTNDVHGTFFDSTYVGDRTRKSIMAINWYVDSVRTAAGRDNVLLLDAGDCLQGDNATYYFNYVDTLTPHIYPRIAAYMDYDAVTVGNHDVETGHPVYDRVAADLARAGIPFMAGNAIRTDDGKPYFTPYATFRRAGLKVLVLGYTNANMKAWLSEPIWSGMTFESLIPLVQQDVDRITAREKPQVVIAAVHSGTGKGDGQVLENQALDLFKSLRGVDVLVCSHDHRPYTAATDSIILINSGSHSRNIGYGEVKVTVSGGRITSKKLSAALIPVDKDKADPVMRDKFRQDYEAVRKFTLAPVGELKGRLVSRDAIKGRCPYMALLHKVSLMCTPAQISFAAPLNTRVDIGDSPLLFNDMFELYPYENQLYVVQLSGRRIKDYLEYSYDTWINAPGEGDGHLLRIATGQDPRYGFEHWHFVTPTYNLDSAAGLNYTVDITRDKGSRIDILSLADGSPFDPDATYNVAMTSYRASGGGDLMPRGAGVDNTMIESLTVAKYPQIRDLIYEYIQRSGTLDTDVLMNDPALGKWDFIPIEAAAEALDRDFDLVF